MPNQTGAIKVLTTAGTTHTHTYENTPERQADANRVIAEALQLLADGSGAFALGNPFAIYNARYVIRIEQE